MKMKAIGPIIAVVALFCAADARAAGDDWFLAVKEANAKLLRYAQARAFGDPKAVRQATMELQADPLAIRLVNNGSPEGFKSQLNKDIGAVHDKTKELIRERVAKRMGVSPDQVTFFEATNKTKRGAKIKVGQDWDLTVRVNGRDVPTKVSQPIANEAYYEAATGKKPASELNRSAVEVANHYAEQQSLAVTDYQYKEAYGGSPKEGEGILFGRKNTRLRDPTQLSKVIEFKSNEAAKHASDLRKEGKRGEAVGFDIEQFRQCSKQYDIQVEPRVKGLGGDVPSFIKTGQEIIHDVASGKLTPYQANEKLRLMGETADSFIRKSAELVEGVQVLQNPNSRGAPAPDVFVENVRNRLRSKGIDPDGFVPAPGGAGGALATVRNQLNNAPRALAGLNGGRSSRPGGRTRGGSRRGAELPARCCQGDSGGNWNSRPGARCGTWH